MCIRAKPSCGCICHTRINGKRGGFCDPPCCENAGEDLSAGGPPDALSVIVESIVRQSINQPASPPRLRGRLDGETKKNAIGNMA